jgi:peptidoglycan LD-endopeptidase CwlK
MSINSDIARIHGRLDSLDVEMRLKALELVTILADLGISIRITQAGRSMKEQEAIYAQGRIDLVSVNALRRAIALAPITEAENQKVVSNAKPGMSWHNYGRAIDFVETVGGAILWESPRIGRIAAVGKAIGLEWGGDWPRPKTDRLHFQLPGKLSLAELAAKQGG